MWKPILLSVLLLALVGCTTSPTGRNQLLLFGRQEMQQMGSEAFDDIKRREPETQDSAIVKYVNCVTRHIVAQVPPNAQEPNWEVRVFAFDNVNAFALPGGKIGVYQGLLNVAENQDQLAAVIGHEVSHVIARHANERVSRYQLANLGMRIASLGFGGSTNAALWGTSLSMGVQVGLLLPYSRREESEADQLGMELMAKAGFDPRASIQLWYNMARNSSGEPPELLSTHPSHARRIQQLQAMVSSVQPLYVKAREMGFTPQCRRPAIPG